MIAGGYNVPVLLTSQGFRSKPRSAITGEPEVSAWMSAVCDWDAPIDPARAFVCSTLTPLYYTPLYPQLTPRQQLRYNQLCAIAFNEVVVFFESSFAAALHALLAETDTIDPALRSRLTEFADDERRH